MKWLYFITTLLCFANLAWADASDRLDDSSHSESKTHQKRELFGHLGKLGSNYDITHVKHSYIKPLMVQYPAQTFPIGVKIPFNNPHHKHPSGHGHQVHHHGSPNHHFHIKTPVHLPKPAWPTNNCNHGQASHPVPQPLPPPTTPIVPTPTGNVPVLAVPIRPALVPPVFDAQPFVPIAAPSIAIAPVLPAPPVVPFAPVAPITPLAPLRPVLPAPVAVPIKHGLSTHSFTFATFPRHPYVNTIPAIAPAPVVPAPIAPLVPAPTRFLPAPAAFLPTHTQLAPVAPLLHRVPLHHVPAPLHHIPAPLPLSKVPLSPLPLHVGKIPFASQSHLFNQIPVNFPVAHSGLSPLPAQTPLGVSPFPQEIPGHFPAAQAGPSPFPHEVPAAHNHFFQQSPVGHNVGEQPFAGESFPQPQNPFIQNPSSQFPTNMFAPEENGIVPGQEGNNFANAFPSQPGVSNVWTPMSNPAPDQFPTFQYPQQEQFPSQTNPDTSQIQPQGTQIPDQQGYTYEQNGNQPFQDGQNIQQNLQQQAEQQFLQAQQYFNQQNEPSQEQNHQVLQEQQNHQVLQEQQHHQQLTSQHHQQQQQQQEADDVQQFSQQQFISGPQLSSGDPQHDPQIPQALPDHPLSGTPINQAYVRINHRRRLRKRPQRNQEE